MDNGFGEVILTSADVAACAVSQSSLRSIQWVLYAGGCYAGRDGGHRFMNY